MNCLQSINAKETFYNTSNVNIKGKETQETK